LELAADSTRSKRLIWTAEWFLENGSRCLAHHASDEKLAHAYTIALRALRHQRLQPQRSSKETRQFVQHLDSELNTPPLQVDSTDGFAQNRGQENMPSSVDTGPASDETTLFRTDVDSLSSIPRLPDIQLYLIKPMTRGLRKVLIPVHKDSTIAEVLYNREVLEFPTFQVLSYPPEDLPSSFVLESEYSKRLKIQHQEMENLVASERGQFSEGIMIQDKHQLPVKSQSIANTDDILAILQRDIQSN
jgi:hypothetical protein